MKATLVYWHKARLQGRYILEIEIHQVERSLKYRDGIKYGLILLDLQSGKRVLMDNHHPKGPHVHLNDQEVPYRYVNGEKLLKDFKELVLQNMGIKI
ncbi:MAG: hypothetical protein HYU99_03670 [Deltaproteobacteria bacterium]|nr:hypothetical protein [Deltaproteobacteria bacterium]